MSKWDLDFEMCIPSQKRAASPSSRKRLPMNPLLTFSLCHCLLVSLSHCLIVSLSSCLIVSLSPCPLVFGDLRWPFHVPEAAHFSRRHTHFDMQVPFRNASPISKMRNPCRTWEAHFELGKPISKCTRFTSKWVSIRSRPSSHSERQSAFGNANWVCICVREISWGWRREPCGEWSVSPAFRGVAIPHIGDRGCGGWVSE
jgi:hypothetical protein